VFHIFNPIGIALTAFGITLPAAAAAGMGGKGGYPPSAFDEGFLRF